MMVRFHNRIPGKFLERYFITYNITKDYLDESYSKDYSKVQLFAAQHKNSETPLSNQLLTPSTIVLEPES